jgi:hypothetical protein
MRIFLIPAALLASSLAACYGPPDHAEILVDTSPPGAACVLSRAGQPLVALAPTPSIALVDPAAAPLAVSCRRPGFADANVALPPYPSSVYERRVDIPLVPWGAPPR